MPSWDEMALVLSLLLIPVIEHQGLKARKAIDKVGHYKILKHLIYNSPKKS